MSSLGTAGRCAAFRKTASSSSGSEANVGAAALNGFCDEAVCILSESQEINLGNCLFAHQPPLRTISRLEKARRVLVRSAFFPPTELSEK